MEIFNNIWAVLTTPNELNTELILLPFTVLESYIILTLCFIILNIHTNKKSKILYTVILLSLINIVSGFLIPTPFNVFINYISSSIFIM